MEVMKAKALGMRVTKNGDGAGVRAATQVNAEQALYEAQADLIGFSGKADWANLARRNVPPPPRHLSLYRMQQRKRTSGDGRDVGSHWAQHHTGRSRALACAHFDSFSWWE
jgi:hypothetical protein